jgi:hypothetical protein
MSFLSSLFDWFKDLFSGIWDWLKEHWLIVLLVVLAVCLMNPALMSAVWTWLSQSWIVTSLGAWFGEFALTDWLWFGAGIWFLADPQGAIETVTEIIADTIETIASAVSSGLGLPTLALGIAALYLFTHRGGANT